MNKIRKLIATAVIGGAMSAGAAGVAFGAGVAAADPLPPYSSLPCSQSYYYCGGHNGYNPVVQGPGIPR